MSLLESKGAAEQAHQSAQINFRADELPPERLADAVEFYADALAKNWSDASQPMQGPILYEGEIETLRTLMDVELDRSDVIAISNHVRNQRPESEEEQDLRWNIQRVRDRLEGRDYDLSPKHVALYSITRHLACFTKVGKLPRIKHVKKDS